MASAKGRRVYASRRWKRTRAYVLARDGYRCVPCGKRGVLEVHHKRPIALGGDWFDLGNLEAICRDCHIGVTAEQNRKPLSPERQALMEMAHARA